MHGPRLCEAAAIERIARLLSWRPGQLAWNTAHAAGWNVIRIGLQAGSLILMARLFGAGGYGALAGTLALFGTCAQVVGLGSGVALVRHIAREREHHARLVSTQLAYASTGLLACILALPLSTALLGDAVPAGALACLAVTEIVVTPALLPLAYRYQALERMFLSGAMLTLATFTRFAAVLSAFLLGRRDIGTFSVMYLCCLTAGTVAIFLCAWPRVGGKRTNHNLLSTLREGLPFVVSGVATTAGGELDKTIVLRSLGEVMAGQYAAASRIVQAATLPINSLVLATTPRLFATRGSKRRRQALQLFGAAFTYAMVAASMVWALAPLAPTLLGRSFDSSVDVLRMLCIVIITNCMRQITVMLLTTHDMQATRNRIEITAIATSLLAMAPLIQWLGTAGVIVALTAGDVLIMALSLRTLVRT